MKVWFNHWFSTSYHLINLMKKPDPKRFSFIGSSTNPYALYKMACHEFYPEKHDVSDEEYLEFCLDFCKKHAVDIFVPRHNLVSVVENHQRFADIGVKLFADLKPEIVRKLNNKFASYELMRKIVPERVPEIIIAKSCEEFEAAFLKLAENHRRVCYKLTVDEGARSFRVIDNSIESCANLYNNPGNKITLEASLKILKEYNFKIPVMLMPYLDGVEISVDCLKTSRGNIIIPRYKQNARYSEVIFDGELMDECSRILDALELEMPMNVQYKKGEGSAYLLEINTRMSGGLQMSCEASGINLPGIALYKLIGEDLAWSYPEYKSMKAANLETPICLE